MSTVILCHASAVLRGIEDLRARNARPEQLQEGIIELFNKHISSATREETQRKDAISHFVLRLAYCRTEELRRWFLSQECDLFRARFRHMLPDEQRQFLEMSGFPFKSTTLEEFQKVKDSLAKTALAVTGSVSMAQSLAQGNNCIHESIYRVPFEQVPDLVASRKVFINKGWAFVSKDQLSSLVGAPFRSALSKALVITARRWATTVAPAEADRLAPIVESLSQRYLGADYSDPEKRGLLGTVSAADVPGLSRQSFPLCMQNMYSALMETGHLKHDGRMQLGLFLKGIGLPLEEAIRFWRMAMAQTAPGEKFDKNYLYNVRHNYGKEGNRKDYTPYACSRVISATPGVGQVHGCPYKTFAPEAVRSALSRAGVSPEKIEEAVMKAKGGHYQLACASAWEGAHSGCECETGINHPNQYYEESRRCIKEQPQLGEGDRQEEKKA